MTIEGSYQVRQSRHGRYVVLELCREQGHLLGLLPVGHIVGKQDDLNFRFGRNFPEMVSVPLGGDTNGTIVSVVGRFAWFAFDVSVLEITKKTFNGNIQTRFLQYIRNIKRAKIEQSHK